MSETRRLRASTVCEAEGHLLVIRLEDPTTGVVAVYPPGGGIEPGEAPVETAAREALEETGLRVRVDRQIELVDLYPFRWNGVDYECTTHYFGADLVDPFDPVLPKVVDADYNLGAAWLPTNEALEAIAVNPRIGTAVARVLGRMHRAKWRKNPTLGGPAAMLLGIHDQFRVASQRLMLLLDEPGTLESGWLARSFRPLAETLHHHHHAEEAMLFPVICDRTGVAPERLVSDHEELATAIDAVTSALGNGADDTRSVLVRFDDILVDHLDREEALVVPVLLDLTPSEVWSMFN